MSGQRLDPEAVAATALSRLAAELGAIPTPPGPHDLATLAETRREAVAALRSAGAEARADMLEHRPEACPGATLDGWIAELGGAS